jgi:hypothetical protein
MALCLRRSRCHDRAKQTVRLIPAGQSGAGFAADVTGHGHSDEGYLTEP